REKVTARLTTLRRWLDDRPGPESVAAILEALRDHDAEERRDLLATIVADGSHTPANRLAALALWPRGDEGKGQARLLGLAAALEDGPVLAAAIRQITKPSLTQATPLLERELDSSDPSVRAATVEVIAALGVPGVGERLRGLLADRDQGVRRSAAAA